MKTLRYFARSPALAGALLLVALLAAPFLSDAADKPAAPAPQASLTVTTVTPGSADWPVRLGATGTVAAWQEAIIGAEASGLRLTDVLADVGTPVTKGQLLATLQSETVAAERDQIQANLAEAEATLAEARHNAQRARQVEHSGALSEQQIAQYLTGEQTARARVDALKAQLKASQVRLAQTRIVAPDSGTVTARGATLGAVVQPGMELFRMIRGNRLEWRAELPAADLARVKPGMPATLTTAGRNTLRGRIRLVAPTLDEKTRNGMVYVDLLDTADARAGMFARGEIEIARSTVMTLPQSAVLLRDGFSWVFRLGKNNRVVLTKVQTGIRSGNLIAINSGLSAGETVVATGVGFLADGDTVRLAPTAKAQ